MCFQDEPPYDAPMLAEASAAARAVPHRPLTTCERVTGYRPRLDGWGSVPLHCGQSVGLTSWTDGAGVIRYACHVHRGELMRRYPA
jgi:hypothetical protein